MKRLSLGLTAVLLASACSSFGSGTAVPGGGVNPPVNGTNAMPATPGTTSPSPSPSAIPTGTIATYPFAQGPSGLQCPEVAGFTCNLSFNVVATASPQPAKANTKGKPTATPSPTPTPSPSPSASASASPGASPTSSASPSPATSATPSGAHLSIEVAALPKDAPKMNQASDKAVSTVALMTVRLKPDADVTLQNQTIATFTIPKEQVGGRGFALQLYRESQRGKRRNDTFFGNYHDSTLKGNTLTFALALPPIAVKKNETWMLVLYGDEIPSASAAPASPGVSAAPSASPSPGASASVSASPSAQTSAQP